VTPGYFFAFFAFAAFLADALASEYVKHETSVLSNRAHTEKGFHVFIVLLDEQISRTSLGQGTLRAAIPRFAVAQVPSVVPAPPRSIASGGPWQASANCG
jgi:hypothetical protein